MKLTPPINGNDHIQGSPSAEITLVEYGDFQCPHCGAAYPVVKTIQRHFGKRLLFAYRHFPLTQVHEYAWPAALAAEAAGRQNQFWPMHDMLFENQSMLGPYAFISFAKALGLDIPTFKMDIQDEALNDKVESDFESGVRSGVNGTPSFFINGYKYNGSYDYISLTSAIEEKIEPAY